MAWASTAAGLCQSYSRCISQHSLEHALSAFHPDLPHGAGLTLISVAYFGFLAARGEERLGDIALAMGDTLEENLEEEVSGVAFLDALDALIQAVGLADEKLSDYGVTREEIPALAENALGWPASCPNPAPGSSLWKRASDSSCWARPSTSCPSPTAHGPFVFSRPCGSS